MNEELLKEIMTNIESGLIVRARALISDQCSIEDLKSVQKLIRRKILSYQDCMENQQGHNDIEREVDADFSWMVNVCGKDPDSIYGPDLDKVVFEKRIEQLGNLMLLVEQTMEILKVDSYENQVFKNELQLDFKIEATGVMHLFRQLRNLQVLRCSDDELVRFMKRSVKNFENQQHQTLLTEIRRKTAPKKESNLYTIVVEYLNQRHIEFWTPEEHLIRIPIAAIPNIKST